MHKKNEIGQDTGDATAHVQFAAITEKPEAVETHADEELEAFCDRLRGYTCQNVPAVMSKRDHTPLPRGFDNVRVFDGHDI